MRTQRRNMRIWVSDQGQVEVIDPGFDAVRLFRSLDPHYRIYTEKLPAFTTPRFSGLRGASAGLGYADSALLADAELWRVHERCMHSMRSKSLVPKKRLTEASILDLKIELARRLMRACVLCGHRCRVNRLEGQTGVCGLGQKAVVAEHFVHIAEETPINPSLLVCLSGCGLRCRSCQQADLLDPLSVVGFELDLALWPMLDVRGARSLSFIGGNPDESLWAILKFLNAAPAWWKLPVVWNCNGFASPETMALLDGVVDAYVPDFKFGNAECSRRLATASNYFDVARFAIGAMLDQQVPVMARILVLPGHSACCHEPVIDALAKMNTDLLTVSLLNQFRPFGLQDTGSPLDRRPSPDQITDLKRYAEHQDLTLTF